MFILLRKFKWQSSHQQAKKKTKHKRLQAIHGLWYNYIHGELKQQAINNNNNSKLSRERMNMKEKKCSEVHVPVSRFVFFSYIFNARLFGKNAFMQLYLDK